MSLKLKEKFLNLDIKHRFLYISLGTTGVILLIYLIFVAYFNTHFYFNTYINEIDVSGKSIKKVNDIMNNEAYNYSLAIECRDGSVEYINGKDIGLKYDFDKQMKQIVKRQNPFLWVKSVFEKDKYDILNKISYDEYMLNKQIESLNCAKSENMILPVNASIQYKENIYEIVPETKGTKLKTEEFINKIEEYIYHIKTNLNLENESCYENPLYTSESQLVIDTLNQVNLYLNSKITYKFKEAEEVIDFNRINQWIEINPDFSVNIKENDIKSYLNELASKYNYLGNFRNMTRVTGEQIKISTTPNIYYLDVATECNNIINLIKEGNKTDKKPTFITPSSNDSYIINTFIEINLARQYVTFYKNGTIIAQGSCVTGDTSKGYTTPPGVFRLSYKQKNAILRGDDYETPVTYWMPFNGGIGLHDATWRSNFGGQIYKYSGSHGCVNLPYNLAKTIFENLDERTTIICR